MAVKNLVGSYPALGLIGNTPLVEVPIFRNEFPQGRVYAKMEAFNPGGSVKDRPVARMLTDAIARGDLRAGMTILDWSSGNAGIAYAMIGEVLGYPVEIVMVGGASDERKRRIRVHGARVVSTDSASGYDGALREAQRRFEATPEEYYFADQYSNESNWLAHYDGTASEILAQAPPGFTHFVAGVGTGGTVTGVGRRLREERPGVQIVCVAAPEFPGVAGLKPWGPGQITPEVFDPSVVDVWVDIDVDQARRQSRQLARHGLFVGQSSGAYMCAARCVLLSDPHAVIVTLFPDTGERYFSAGLWDA